jgi:PmbA protein
MYSIKNRNFNNPSALSEVAEQVLQIAKQKGLNELEISLFGGEGIEISIRETACESIEHQKDKSIAITVYQNGRKGSAKSSDFSISSLNNIVESAATIAGYTEVDPYAGLIEQKYLCKEIIDLDLDYPWNIEIDEMIKIAKDAESAALKDTRQTIRSDGVNISSYRGARVYANSLGFNHGYHSTRHGLSAIMIAESFPNQKQKGYWSSSHRDATKLMVAEEVGALASARAVRKLNAKKIPTGRYPVLFEPRISSSIIGHVLSAISGKAQYEKNSFLADSLGKLVLPNFISISEDPHLKTGPSSAPFDNDGVRTIQKNFVSSGCVRNYALDGYAAKKLQMEPTGNSGGFYNIAVTGGECGQKEMIQSVERGLLITDLMGFGVNLLTGDYSRGASGFLIENGELTHPVEEITIAGNLKEMLIGITQVGNDADIEASIKVGTLSVDSMTVAGE